MSFGWWSENKNHNSIFDKGIGRNRELGTGGDTCLCYENKLQVIYSFVFVSHLYYYTPCMYAAGYIVFALKFVRSYVRSLVRSFVTFRHVRRIYLKVSG